jgi:hypothetical protein
MKWVSVPSGGSHSGGAERGAIKWENLLWLNREIGRNESGQHFT